MDRIITAQQHFAKGNTAYRAEHCSVAASACAAMMTRRERHPRDKGHRGRPVALPPCNGGGRVGGACAGLRKSVGGADHPTPTKQKRSADCSALLFKFWLPDLDSNQGPAD